MGSPTPEERFLGGRSAINAPAFTAKQTRNSQSFGEQLGNCIHYFLCLSLIRRMVGIAPQEGQLHYLQIGFESPWHGKSILSLSEPWLIFIYYIYNEYMCRFECDGSSWLGRPFAAFSDSIRLDRLWIWFPRKRLSVLSFQSSDFVPLWTARS
jgi:hypothetical protein